MVCGLTTMLSSSPVPEVAQSISTAGDLLSALTLLTATACEEDFQQNSSNDEKMAEWDGVFKEVNVGFYWPES